MVTRTVDIQEAEENFRELLALVQEGTEVIVEDRGKAVVRLAPVRETGQWHEKPPTSGELEVWTATLNSALDGFWEGFTPEEVNETVEAMNAEYIEPEEPGLFDWLDEQPEDER